MRDEEVFNEAVRAEDWTRLAGSPADARARSSRLRRTRAAGIAGATTAVVAIAAVVAVSLGAGGSARGDAVSAGSGGGSSKPSSSKSSAAVLPQKPAKPTKPVKGTMGALFEQWKSCPDSELSVKNLLPQDPSNLQQRWRDACRRDVATLTALLPGYDVSPAVSGLNMPQGDLKELLPPDKFDDPSFVIPPGYTPHMGPSMYRIGDKDGGVGTKVVIRAYGHDDQTKPHTGEQVTLPNGLQAQVTLGTELTRQGETGYEIYILDHGKTFYMFLMSQAKPSFDFKALVTSPLFANMAAQALAEPES